MNVLVTGGAGYIGSHTCVELLEAGHTPIVVDNLCNSSEVSLQRVREITGKEVVFIRGDVRDEALLDQVMEQSRPACAIHFAGLKAVGESVEKPLAYYDNNLRSTLSLCRAMARAGVKRIIFSSSATVYSGDNEMPLGEDARTADVDARTLTDCIKTFCGRVEAEGYKSMIYFNPHFHENEVLYLDELTDYHFWLAMYDTRMDYPYQIDMWQYSCTGSVPGIYGDVDLNLYLPRKQ